MRGFENPDDPRTEALERKENEAWLDRELHEDFSLNEAIEMTRVTGDTRYAMACWDRNRIALLHDWIQDQLDDPPAGVSAQTVARLEDSLAGLRADLARIVTA